MRTLLRPRWLGGHLMVVAMCAVFVLLGRWQWSKSQGPYGDLQNFAYALQWWIFVAVALGWWIKILRDELHPTAPRGPRTAGPARSVPVARIELAGPGDGTELAEPGDRTELAGSSRRRDQVAATAGSLAPALASVSAAPPQVEQPVDQEMTEWNAWLAYLNAHPRR